MEDKKETQVKKPDENFVVETVEDDMKKLGISVEPQKSEEKKQKEDTEKENKENTTTTKEVKKKSRAQRRIEAQQRTIKELRKKIDEINKSSNDTKKEDIPDQQEPNIEDFETYEDYLDALEKYEFEDKKQQKENKQQNENKQQKEEPQDNEKVALILEEGKSIYDDFTDVVLKEDLPITQTMLQEIQESDYAPDILYYLGKNREKAEALAKIKNKRELTAKIYLIEKSLAEEEGKEIKTTKAPEPIKPVKESSPTNQSIDDEGLTFEEYEKLMHQRKLENTGGFL